jgi:hypothetical protein
VALDADMYPVALDADLYPVALDAELSPVALDADMSPVALDADLSPVALDAELYPVALDADISPVALDLPAECAWISDIWPLRMNSRAFSQVPENRTIGSLALTLVLLSTARTSIGFAPTTCQMPP